MVIVMSPTPEDLAGMSEAVEHFFVQALITQLAVEAFDEAVLLRFARGDMLATPQTMDYERARLSK